MQIGVYITERVIEQRGLLTVYAARHETTGRGALITVLPEGNEDQAQQWLARLKAVRRLQHPGIVLSSEGGRTPSGAIYMVTPLFPPAITRKRLYSIDEAVELLRDVSAALDYAHAQGVVHGGLRHIHVVRSVDEPKTSYALNSFELALDSPQDKQADIAALSATILRALMGGGNDAIVSALPTAVVSVIKRARQGDFESAGAFYNAFEEALHLPAFAEPAKPAKLQPSRQPGVPWIGIIAGFVIGVIVLASAALFGLTALQGAAQRPVDPVEAVAQLPTGTATDTVTETLTATMIPATETPSAAPTATSSPTATHTLLPTATSTTSATVTAIPTATATATAMATAAEIAPEVITATSSPPTLAATSVIGGTAAATGEATLASETETAATAAATATATIPPTLTFTPGPPNPCISLVGDSVTHGGVTYEVPATGYIVGLTTPLSVYLERALRERQINDLKVYDRGASHTGISSANHPSYFETDAYKALLRDRCRYTMIMPWINDISPKISHSVAAPRHARALIGLVKQLLEINPQGRIIVLDYFYGAVAPFAEETWASGMKSEYVELFNREIGLSCNAGTLSGISQISCVNIEDAFDGMGTNYVIKSINRQELFDTLIAPLNATQQAWLDQFFAVYPDGALVGDGVHLSTAGKTALAAFLVNMLR